MTGWHRQVDDDAQLVRAVATGSEAALAALYDRHADAIFATALRSTDDRQLAEEVVQETFLALWNRAELYDPASGSLGTWLRAIARNRTIDRLRARGRRPRLVSLGGDPDGPGASVDDLAAVGQLVGSGVEGPDPVGRAERSETLEVVRSAVRALPDEERVVIVLAYQDELSQSEIATRLGWPLGTVKTRTRRALQRLRAAMGERRTEVGGADGEVDALAGGGDGGEGAR